MVLPQKPLRVTRGFLKNNKRVPVGMKLFRNTAFKTGFSDIQEDRKQVAWFCLFVLFSRLSFRLFSYNVSAKDTENRVATVVTTRTRRELRPQLGAADLESGCIRLEAPARPSVS